MFHSIQYSQDRKANYDTLSRQAVELVSGEPDRIANLANLSALLGQFLERINWVGFYLYDGTELVLGPFQGLPACIRIPIGHGVCGKAAAERIAVRVDDVARFPGHIACDSASRSEIVVPIVKNNALIGVLDIDSAELSRFDAIDQSGLEAFIQAVVPHL